MAAASTSVKCFNQNPTEPEGQHWLQEMESRGHLALQLAESKAGQSESLADWLDQAVEAQLHQCGACTRPSYVEQRPASVVPDQLYRARMLGYSGLALLLPQLRAFAEEGVLSGADSLALSEWRRQANAHGVLFRFSNLDAELKVFPDPIALERWLQPDEERVGSSETVASGVVARADDHCADTGERRPSKAHSRSLRHAMRTALAADLPPEPQPASESTPDPVHEAQTPLESAQTATIERLELDELAAPAPSADSVPGANESPPRLSTDDELHESQDASAPSHSIKAAPEIPPGVYGPNPAAEPTAAAPAIGPSPTNSEESRSRSRRREGSPDSPHVAATHASEPPLELLLENLEATDGSHAWSEIERLYINSYLPLQRALQQGQAPVRTESVLATWATDFAESYERAYEAIRSRQGKRPRLVLDTPSHAFQLCRQAEVDQSKLVLVDGMRADLGPLVRDKLKLQLLDRAVCLDEGLLWAALPADTPTQMELIARGMDGLRHFSGALSEQQLMGSNNDMRRLRPVRVGTHRMYKLDVVQHLVRDNRDMTDELLAQCAAEIATSVGRFIRQQNPDTLVYVFGDHGFGGAQAASPERVLVPYLAWKIAS